MLTQFQVGINDLPSLTIFLGQMLKLIDGNGRPVAAHADRGQPLLQIARLPLAVAVVPPFEQVAELQRYGFQGFLEFSVHYVIPHNLLRKSANALTRGRARVISLSQRF